ncbi:hypothetical protein [Streptomyces sp. MST-110588]|uniref:hypothetical protein n=1 Tax=Streptomyces sp. MST-110588 TaxID=2833628 RepID=UPI001F5D66D6|nr:hypothetical protein [Streptomyces sp. MST-110588]UNO40430.1 hypothetical protein KGS77_13655 [Streptomyces sp. MST-110588]
MSAAGAALALAGGGLVVAAGGTASAAPGNPADGDGVRLLVMHAPTSYYLPLPGDGQRVPDFSIALAAGGSHQGEEKKVKGVKARFDLSSLKGKAEVQPTEKCSWGKGGAASLEVMCPLGDFYQRTEFAPFVLRPAAKAAAGDEGTVKMTLTSSNAATVEHSTRVVMGALKLSVRPEKAREQLPPGAKVPLSPAFVNKSAVPVREGVTLSVYTDSGVFAARHSNCRYNKATGPTHAECDFPGPLKPGAAFEVDDPFVATLHKATMSGHIGYSVRPLGNQPEYGGLPESAPRGEGPALGLKAVRDSGFSENAAAELHLRTTQTADWRAVGFTIKGKVGQVVQVKMPFPQNHGPGDEDVRMGPMRVTLPEGVSVVPLDENDQEEALYCTPDKTAGGKARKAQEVQKKAQKAVCPYGPDGFGTILQARIDKRVAGARGTVTAPTDPAGDPQQENNTAPVLVKYTGGNGKGSGGRKPTPSDDDKSTGGGADSGSAAGSGGEGGAAAGGSGSGGTDGTGTDTAGALAGTGAAGIAPIAGGAAASLIGGTSLVVATRRRRTTRATAH